MNKLMNMDEAITRFVHSGDMVYLGGYGCRCVSSASHEIIRQGLRGLTLVRCSLSDETDWLIGAGCVSRLLTSIVSLGVGMGLGAAFRRAMEQGIPNKVEMEDYTNLSLPMMLMAGSLGIPCIPVKEMWGSDLLKFTSFLGKDKFKIISCPFTSQSLMMVPAINPDVAIIHVQQADAEGNAQVWGMEGDCELGAKASGKVIVTAERIISREAIGRDPNRTIMPGFRVDAVVEEPWGSHPLAVTGFYDIDQEFRLMYREASETIEGFEGFMNEWVYDVRDRPGYVAHYQEKYGIERLEGLKAAPYFSPSVNYGY